MKKISMLIVLFAMGSGLHASEPWTVERCLQYAVILLKFEFTSFRNPKNLAHPTNPVEGCADANPKTELPNDT